MTWSDAGQIGQDTGAGLVFGAIGGALGGGIGGLGRALTGGFTPLAQAMTRQLANGVGGQISSGVTGAIQGALNAKGNHQSVWDGALEGWSHGVVSGTAGFVTSLSGPLAGKVLQRAAPGAASRLSAAAHELPSFRQGAALGLTNLLGLPACFCAGTPLRVPGGSRVVEDIQVGDLVLSRPEGDPNGEIAPRVVEEVFVRLGRVWHLHLGDQVIRTTGEHPFYAEGKGWVAVCELSLGDRLRGEVDWVVVEDICDTGEYETVYNLRVAEFHTYFVGCEAWE